MCLTVFIEYTSHNHFHAYLFDNAMIYMHAMIYTAFNHFVSVCIAIWLIY